MHAHPRPPYFQRMVGLNDWQSRSRAPQKKRKWLGLWAVAVLLGSCQLRAGESPVGGRSTAQVFSPVAVAPATPPPAATHSVPDAAPAVLPDTLRLTPVAALSGVPDTLRKAIRLLHAALGPAAAALRPEVLEQACVGYLTLHPTGRIERAGLLAVADMDLPNTTERLWVIDLQHARVLHRSLVAHGEGSGRLRARRFSNEEKSACTSLGFYRTAATYDGIHGYSRRIEGLDKGQNGHAFDRYVVLHAADYASPNYVRQHGHLGYSRGCPALPPEQFKAIIATLRVGSLLLVSGPGLASRWLDGGAAGRRFVRRGWR